MLRDNEPVCVLFSSKLSTVCDRLLGCHAAAARVGTFSTLQQVVEGSTILALWVPDLSRFAEPLILPSQGCFRF